MNRFERRKELKRKSIIDAAWELFKAYGFKKVSIFEISGKAGVSQASIYNHFGSKDELVREVMKSQILGMLGKYREIIKGERPFPEKLEIIIFDKLEIAKEYKGEFFQTAIQSDPELQRFIKSLWAQEVNDLMNSFFDEGKRQGCVNPRISRKSILLYFQIWCRGWLTSANTGEQTELLNELTSLLLYGLAGKKE